MATIKSGQRVMLPAVVVDDHDKGNILLDIFGNRVSIPRVDLENHCPVDVAFSGTATVPSQAGFMTATMLASGRRLAELWRDWQIQQGKYTA